MQKIKKTTLDFLVSCQFQTKFCQQNWMQPDQTAALKLFSEKPVFYRYFSADHWNKIDNHVCKNENIDFQKILKEKSFGQHPSVQCEGDAKTKV